VRYLALAFVLCCFASSAQAQLTTLREHARQMDTARVGISSDLNTFFGNVESAGYAFFQPSVGASFRLYEVVFEAALPFAYFHENNDPGADHNQFAVGHPWFGLSFLPDTVCGLSRLSLGIAPEIMHASNPRVARARALSRAANGDWDGYLWREDTLPLVLGVATRKERGMWRIGWDADLMWGLPGGAREHEFGAQTAGEFALLFGWNTALGTRVSAAYYPTFDGDPFQSALTFYLRYARTQDAFGARFVMNLDGPAGFSFANDGAWGASLFYSRSL
jgi:hypothetical protein